MAANEDKAQEHEKLKKDLAFCETRLKELKGKKPDEKFDQDLEEIAGELKSCRVELDELEGRSGDEWVDAKHGITRKLEDVQRSLQLTTRRMADYIR